MATRSRSTICSRSSSRSSLIGIVLIAGALLMAGCSGNKKTVGLDVDVYLHPSSSDTTDILLQAGIDKRLADSPSTKGALIHVRVSGGLVTLTGAAKNLATKDAAGQIARETELTLNGTAIRVSRENLRNQITIER
jgi:osmotically-inducible protein OsmY